MGAGDAGESASSFLHYKTTFLRLEQGCDPNFETLTGSQPLLCRAAKSECLN